MRVRALGVFWLGIAAISLACSSAELTGAPPPTGPTDTVPVDENGNPIPDGGTRDPVKDLDGGTLPVTSAVTIQVQPSDNGLAVLNAIKGAKTSVHMTMYLLTDNDVINALTALKAAGKEVKVILNKTFPDASTSNASAFTKLQQGGVDVRYGPAGFTFTHAKTIIIDQQKLLVMTMNMTNTSASTNREYIATVTDADDVAEAETIFQADFDNKAFTATGKLLVSPRNSVQVDARDRLVALIDTAKASVDLAGESLSDAAIVDALIAAKNAGLAVRVVIGDQAGSPTQQDAVAKLKQAGVPIKSLSTPDMHAKAIVVDGKLAYVGSQNFTANSLNNNREIGVVTDAAAEVAKVQSTIAKDFGAGTAL